MASLRKAAAVCERFVLELEADHASGCGWKIESDGGLECDSWYDDEEQPGKPGSEGKIQKFSLISDSEGTFRVLLRNSCDPSETVELELVVHPGCDTDYATAAEGFAECLILGDEAHPPWKIEVDDGVGCEIGTKDGRPALFMTGNSPGEYSILLSSADEWRLVKLIVRPVNSRVRLRTVPGKKAVHDKRANATTGFQWRIVDDGGMKCSDYYVSDPNPRGMCGVGGRHFFEMEADSPGIYVVRAVYSRPWEEGYIDALEMTVEVVPDDKDGAQSRYAWLRKKRSKRQRKCREHSKNVFILPHHWSGCCRDNTEAM